MLNQQLYSCNICSLKMQILQLKVTAADSCKYCNQSATGHVTQLIAAIFATQIFAVHSSELTLKSLGGWNQDYAHSIACHSGCDQARGV